MSFDSDPRDEVSAEEYYGEMAITQLREMNAELLEVAKDVVRYYHCLPLVVIEKAKAALEKADLNERRAT